MLKVFSPSIYITHKATKITRLTISCESSGFLQEFTDLDTDTWPMEDRYGLSFDDWNFDGYLDVSLWRYRGGSSLNSPHYYWLWDNTASKFIANEELEDISGGASVSIDYEKNQIYSLTRYGSGGYGIWNYEYQNGHFIEIRAEEAYWGRMQGEEDRYATHIVIQELVDGEMTTTKDYYIE